MLKKRIAAYADEVSVAPGDTLRVMASCEGLEGYEARVVRLLSGDDQPGGPGYREEVLDVPANGRHQGRFQPIRGGAYGFAEPHPALDRLNSLTVQCLVWATTPERPWKAICCRFSEHDEWGWGLFTNGDGHACFFIGDGKGETQHVVAPEPLVAKRWYLLSGSYDAATGTMRVRQRMIEPVATMPAVCDASDTCRLDRVHNPGARFMVAAYNHADEAGDWIAGGHFNGKVERPAVASRVLDDAEVERLAAPGPLPADLSGDVCLVWDFSRDIPTERLVDLSPNRIDGRTVNLPIRAMTGHAWKGETHRWVDAPKEWGAIRFADDMIHDCGWQPDFEVTIPEATRSGIYAVRLMADGSADEFVPFCVRPPAGQPSAKLCLLFPTASYMAYANLGETLSSEVDYQFNRVSRLGADELQLAEHPEFGPSMYDFHSDGTGPHFSSRLRPIVNFSPANLSLWQMSADMHLLAWLEHEGIAYDVISDEDLDREGAALLRQWPCVMTMSHPEYYSTRMLDGIEGYCAQGGRLMYMGGNGFYWRIAYSDRFPGAIEMRRSEDGSRSWVTEPGEYYMAFTGEMGGLWWRCGRAPQQLAGVGFIAQGFDRSSPFRLTEAAKDPRAAWMFEGIDEDVIGDFGLLGGGAAGWELDRADPERGTPPHALVVASSSDHSDTVLLVNEEIGHMHPMIHGQLNEAIHADLVFFETANGGAVWSTGSIAYVSALPCNGFDNNIARLTRNVVERFCDETPFGQTA